VIEITLGGKGQPVRWAKCTHVGEANMGQKEKLMILVFILIFTVACGNPAKSAATANWDGNWSGNGEWADITMTNSGGPLSYQSYASSPTCNSTVDFTVSSQNPNQTVSVSQVETTCGVGFEPEQWTLSGNTITILFLNNNSTATYSRQ